MNEKIKYAIVPVLGVVVLIAGIFFGRLTSPEPEKQFGWGLGETVRLIDSSGNAIDDFGGADVDLSSFTTGTDKGQLIMGLYQSSLDTITTNNSKGVLAMDDRRRLYSVSPAYDETTNLDGVFQGNPVNENQDCYTVTFTNIAAATPEYTYVNMSGYSGMSVHVEETGGTATFEATMESSNEGVDSTVDWIDTTSDCWNFTSTTADGIGFSKEECFAKGHRLKIDTAGSDDGDYSAYICKWY